MSIRLVLALLAVICGAVLIFAEPDDVGLIVGLGIIFAALAAVIDR